MKIVVDTNVFVSGVFFTGPSYTILDAWRRCIVQIVVSPAILDEYRRVGAELANRFPRISLQPAFDLLAAAAITIPSRRLPQQVCRDPDDDKFLACAMAGKAKHVITGDKAMLATSGYAGVTVLTPREFVERYLKGAKA
jgi:putative PIN family toxin of toxin-antitoxin system